jgi:hypothetical protein
MAVDLLGPASALNSVTTRPAQAVTYGATRTWFKNCTSLTSSNGTELTNDWLNNILAQLRTAFDGMGIVEDNGDSMLLRAIESIGIRYGTDIGSAGALVVNNTLPVAALANNLFIVTVAHTCAGATTCNIDSLGNKAVVDANGAALVKGAYQADNLLAMVYDGTSLRIIAGAKSIPDITSAFSSSTTVTEGLTNAVVQSVSVGTGTVVSDIGSCNSVTFTCTRAGLYSVGSSLTVVINYSAAGNASINTSIYKNGSVLPGVTDIVGIYQPSSGTGSYGLGINTVVSLAVGDTIGIYEEVQGGAISSMYINGANLIILPLD